MNVFRSHMPYFLLQQKEEIPFVKECKWGMWVYHSIWLQSMTDARGSWEDGSMDKRVFFFLAFLKTCFYLRISYSIFWSFAVPSSNSSQIHSHLPTHPSSTSCVQLCVSSPTLLSLSDSLPPLLTLFPPPPSLSISLWLPPSSSPSSLM